MSEPRPRAAVPLTLFRTAGGPRTFGSTCGTVAARTSPWAPFPPGRDGPGREEDDDDDQAGAAMRAAYGEYEHVVGRTSWGFEIPYRDSVTNERRTFTAQQRPAGQAGGVAPQAADLQPVEFTATVAGPSMNGSHGGLWQHRGVVEPDGAELAGAGPSCCCVVVWGGDECDEAPTYDE